jgi:hypothetical protein
VLVSDDGGDRVWPVSYATEATVPLALAQYRASSVRTSNNRLNPTDGKRAALMTRTGLVISISKLRRPMVVL